MRKKGFANDKRQLMEVRALQLVRPCTEPARTRETALVASSWGHHSKDESSFFKAVLLRSSSL